MSITSGEIHRSDDVGYGGVENVCHWSVERH